MAIFQFDNIAENTSTTGPNAAIEFTDNGVTFTLSTTANPGAGNNNGVFYNGGAGDDGQLSITDYAGAGTWTLDVKNTAVSTNFGKTATMTLGPSMSSSWKITFVATGTGANFVTTVTSGQVGTVINATTSTEFSAIKFSPAGAGGAAFLTIDSLTATIVCYLEDTGIATPAGNVAVQDLRPGDKVLTAGGAETTVKWVGVQPVDTRIAHPAKVNPICISAGAIAQNIPERDLFVSPDHAIEIAGMLYNASALVNGKTIYKVAKMPLEGFTYYHVETDAHELIMAEGCPAESYLDMPDRSGFVNGAERAGAPMIEEMPLSRITASRLVPQEVQDQLAARAEALSPSERAA